MTKVRKEIFVSGRVQRVYFREATRRAALAAGVTGWVQNLPDGRVQAVVEGEGDRVAQVVEFMRSGPPLARVDRIEVSEGSFAGEFDDFSVRR